MIAPKVARDLVNATTPVVEPGRDHGARPDRFSSHSQRGSCGATPRGIRQEGGTPEKLSALRAHQASLIDLYRGDPFRAVPCRSHTAQAARPKGHDRSHRPPLIRPPGVTPARSSCGIARRRFSRPRDATVQHRESTWSDWTHSIAVCQISWKIGHVCKELIYGQSIASPSC